MKIKEVRVSSRKIKAERKVKIWKKDNNEWKGIIKKNNPSKNDECKIEWKLNRWKKSVIKVKVEWKINNKKNPKKNRTKQKQ